MPVAAGASKEAPHGEENTGIDAHPPIAFRSDRGPSGVADGRAELVKLATRLIVEEALETESWDAVGRGYYEHGATPGRGYRNGSRTLARNPHHRLRAPPDGRRQRGSRSGIRGAQWPRGNPLDLHFTASKGKNACFMMGLSKHPVLVLSLGSRS